MGILTNRSHTLSNYAPTLIVLALCAVALYFFNSLILLFFLAFLMALLVSIPSEYLQSKGLKKMYALGLSLLILTIPLALLILIVVPSLADGIADLVEELPGAMSQLSGIYDSFRERYAFLPTLESLTPSESSSENLTGVLGSVSSGLGSLGNVLIDIFVVVVMAIFLSVSPKEYRNTFLMLVPKANQDRAEEIIHILHHDLRTWITTMGMSMAVTATLVWVLLSLIGFPNAFVIALVAGIATLIPNIGLVIPIIPIIIFGVNSDAPQMTFYALGIYLAVQLVESNFITPSFMKAGLNLLPAGILLFQIIVATLFGFMGILLAVPILVVLVVLVRELYCYDLLHKKRLKK